MSYEPKDMSGALFKNDKGGNEKRPDYRGDICINGVVYELASWIKTGNKGKWMSLSVKPKEATKPRGNEKPLREPPRDDFESSEIPF